MERRSESLQFSVEVSPHLNRESCSKICTNYHQGVFTDIVLSVLRVVDTKTMSSEQNRV